MTTFSMFMMSDWQLRRASPSWSSRSSLAAFPVSSDTDFGELLAPSNATSPSDLLFRRQGQRRAIEVAALLPANLRAVESDLLAGTIVVFDNDRIRIRSLPLNPQASARRGRVSNPRPRDRVNRPGRVTAVPVREMESSQEQ